MAQSNTPSTAEYKNTPPQDPFASPLTSDDLENESEDPDEWEYEYSATETETYYVTLDLTTPDVKPPVRKRENGGNRNIKAKWLNPGMERTEPKKHKSHYTRQATNANEDTETPAEPQTPQPDADVEDDASIRPGYSASQEEGAGEAAKVQVLGLHTRNPIVSYGGHVYSCQWASNIGTELLFTEHDPDNSIPVLRHLPGNVDLLAASSTRIISCSVVLEPKPQHPSKPKNGENKSGNDPRLTIPVGIQASDRRKGQARFLERLMEIKEAKGEDDEVTVYTEKKLSRKGWKTYLIKKRKEERTRVLKVVKKSRDMDEVQRAKDRLVELDKEEAEMKEVERKWLEDSRPQGTGRRRVRGGALDLETLRKRVRVGEDGDQGTPYGESGSTPTPRRWEDGEDSEDMDEDMIQDDDDDLFDDEQGYGDEDALGDDEDTYGWN